MSADGKQLRGPQFPLNRFSLLLRQMLSTIPNKREFLARRLRDLGLLRLLEHTTRRPGLLVLTHHRIGDPATSPYYELVYSASTEAFRAQVCYLRDHFRIVSPDDFESACTRDEPTAIITFDDGYRDNFDVAFPILNELGVRATFFIPTRLFEQAELSWWDHTAFVIKTTQREQIVLDLPSPMVIEIGPDARSVAIRVVISLYLKGKISDEHRFRKHLEERAEVTMDSRELGRALFMSWDHIRQLAAAGMSIGSHAHTHRKLAALSDDEQQFELTESKRILEHELGRGVRALAYPFGSEGTYNQTTERLAQAAGYEVAFSAHEGINRPGNGDRFALRRVSVGYTDSPALFRARTTFYVSFGQSPF